MKRKFYRQEPGSHTCGQIALAHLYSLKPEEVFEVLGKGRTTTRQLSEFTEEAGLGPIAPCTVAMKRSLLSFAKYKTKRKGKYLAKVRDWRKTGWHWVAVIDGIVYDGVFDAPIPLKAYLMCYLGSKRRITSASWIES